MLIAALLALVMVAGQQPSPAVRLATRSATLARDIGGFALGMPIAEAKTLASLTPIGNGEYEARKDGITYNLAVTGLGRIYRVTSSQNLGRFTLDAVFLADLRAKLLGRYGRPTSSSAEVFSWDLIENVVRADGSRMPFRTNWASAQVSGGGGEVSLEMTMLDFRVEWADEAKLDAAPRRRASEQLRF